MKKHLLKKFTAYGNTKVRNCNLFEVVFFIDNNFLYLILLKVTCKYQNCLQQFQSPLQIALKLMWKHLKKQIRFFFQNHFKVSW
jgi:hypothetical protein